jgi:hypothetical protein
MFRFGNHCLALNKQAGAGMKNGFKLMMSSFSNSKMFTYAIDFMVKKYIENVLTVLGTVQQKRF